MALLTLSSYARRYRDGRPTDRYWVAREAYARVFTRWVAKSFDTFGEGSWICPPGIFWGASNISVGRNAWIGPNTRLNAEGRGRIVLGDGTAIHGYTAISAHRLIALGERVLVAHGVTMVDHQHRTEDPTRHIADQGIDRIAPIRIGDGAWIGTGAVILPGVTIGRNAVVGANAVVRSDVPDYRVVVGNPARLLERESTQPNS